MRKIYLAFAFFTFLNITTSQEYIITGIIADRDTGNPLEAATVFNESLKDSSLISYTISDKSGSFTLTFRSFEKATNFFVTYNGYETYKKKITFSDKEIALGKILLTLQAEELEAVNVVADRVPITIKKDTLEFNSDSFKTRPDATVEDLLKKLPGVEVDSDGTITVNGQEVKEVLVNGQRFFSSDATIATKSLPKDIISKVQITDSKTKKEEFTGQSSSSDTKTINLTIKKDKNKGFLGRAAVGYGTDERYQLNGLLNYFKDKTRLSLIAGSNNINNPGFSFDEIFDMVGNGRGRRISGSSGGGFSINNLSFGFGEGIVTSNNLGVSYADAEPGEYEINGNYFYSDSDSYNDSKTVRENILPDGSFTTESISEFDGYTSSHQGSTTLQFDVTPTLRITAQPTFSANWTDAVDYDSTITTNETDEILNQSISKSLSHNKQYSFQNSLSVIKKLDTLGRNISFEFSNENLYNTATSNFNSLREVFGENSSEEELDQESSINNKNNSYSAQLGYRQPLSANLALEFKYQYNFAERKNSKMVYDFNENNGAYDIFNETLSSRFIFENIRQIPSIELDSNTEKFDFNIGARYVNTSLENEDLLQEITFDKDYKNLLFNARLRYQINKTKRIGMFYRSDVSVPQASVLQPIEDVSNPLNIKTGNPNLSPTISHRLNFNYSNYNWMERSGFVVYSVLQMYDDQIISVTQTTADGLRRTTYTNQDGVYNFYGGVHLSKQIKKDSLFNVKLNISPGMSLGRNVSLTNDQKIISKYATYTPGASINFNFKEILEIEPGYSISFNNTNYNIDNFKDVSFVSQNGSFVTTLYWPENIIWGNDIKYTYNGNVGEGFKKDALFWNMSLGMNIMKNKGSIKVLAYDLLNQNLNTRRTTGETFIQDYQGTVLKQYFMFSFTYKFDQFGGKAPKSDRRRMYRRL
ncbi:outer membrane beta-barrel family protein [Abyssalbus ytuae]|uniref:Outer membrane beta-barrel protein n=1 Tax=Abyssalbus ytuae TaxID=2926907 RepID=A0A9E7D0N1_9FLAO|nr:outer membrane beta-barrel family protein [Abyssalbus ytuae]UOB18565.1 outer membrane beta-barrel protein [Abyssalbus ytuae]